jgi:RHS repeat-associated protein
MKTAKTERKIRLSWQTMCMSFPKSLQYPRQPHPSPADDVRSTFTYDGMGRRTQEITLDGSGDQVVRDLYYSTSWQVLEDRVNNVDTTHYVWSAVYVDALILRDRDTDGNGSLDERLYATSDANFNVTAIIDTSGTVQERFRYNAYFQRTDLAANFSASDDSKNWVVGAQGLMRDQTTGFWSARNRWYSDTMNVWLTSDPIMAGMNWYQPFGGNPINRLDPNGTAVIARYNGFIGRGDVDAIANAVLKLDAKLKTIISGLDSMQNKQALSLYPLAWNDYQIYLKFVSTLRGKFIALNTEIHTVGLTFIYDCQKDAIDRTRGTKDAILTTDVAHAKRNDRDGVVYILDEFFFETPEIETSKILHELSHNFLNTDDRQFPVYPDLTTSSEADRNQWLSQLLGGTYFFEQFAVVQIHDVMQVYVLNPLYGHSLPGPMMA